MSTSKIDLKKAPYISIIIPTYNEEKYIRQTLLHAKSQKYSGKFEIIVSDCNSTDKTREIAEENSARVINCSMKGTGAARNMGADAAKGDILLFVDADAWLPPDYLEEAYKKLVEEPDIVALSAAFRFTPRKPYLLILQFYINTRFWIQDKLFHKSPVLGYNFYIRKDEFYNNGKFEECFFEDLYLYRKLNITGKKTRYLTYPIVTISARRLEKYGFLNTYRYYNVNKAVTEQYLFDSWYKTVS
ncbi:MAG: glycosyltransferase [Candidatus Ranarchaeia archaeon]